MNCNVIKDLLPLYVENMVSPESKELVDEHLCGCESCKKELESLHNVPKLPLEVETASLKRVEKTIKMREKKKIFTICIVFVLIVSGFLYWVYRHPYYQYQKDGILTADSGVAVTSAGPIPKDIEQNSLKWAETLRHQHYLFEERYVSHEATYHTTVQDSCTIIVFQGTGVTANNDTEEIYDVITLPFRLYGVE